jgi:hypothetical protein
MSFYKLSKFIIVRSLLIIYFLNIYSSGFAEIIILSSCDSKQNSFKKNEYILDLGKSLMTRNFIYDYKTYKKLKLTDLKTKKKNSIVRYIYEEDDSILTDKIGYPQFYTQLLFEKKSLIIKIKTVINNEVGVSILSRCKEIEKFDKKT